MAAAKEVMTGLGVTDPFTVFVASALFWVAAILGVVTAYVMVGVVRNLVRAALALTLVLASVALIYGVLAADFLAVVQLVVYIGAIMVLMIFAIMMTPGQIDDPGSVSAGQHVGAILVAGLVLFVSVFVIVAHDWPVRRAPLEVSIVDAIGGLMLSTYVLPFEIAGLVLTVALIGATVIARED